MLDGSSVFCEVGQNEFLTQEMLKDQKLLANLLRQRLLQGLQHFHIDLIYIYKLNFITSNSL